jgi:hypothetical protein
MLLAFEIVRRPQGRVTRRWHSAILDSDAMLHPAPVQARTTMKRCPAEQGLPSRATQNKDLLFLILLYEGRQDS